MIRRMALFFCAAGVLASCRSADTGIRDMGQPVGTYHVAADVASVMEEQETAASRAEKEVEDVSVIAAGGGGNERTDEYLGIAYTPERNLTLESEKVRVVLRGKAGTFNIYAIDEKGKGIPIFAPTDDAMATFFSVLVGKREYRLNRAASVDRQVRRTAGGGQIAYTLKRQFQTVLDFTLLSSETGGEADIVRITVYTTNLAKNRQTLAVRAVLDTVLGESQPYHFVTASHDRIYGEKQFTLFSRDRFFYSGDDRTTAQILVEGKTMQPPQVVSFAGRDTLTDGPWFPVIHEEKGFGNIRAYSNSAIGINWQYFSVEPGETSHVTFYIAVGTDGEPPKGSQFVDSLVDESLGAPQDGADGETDPDVPEVSESKLDPAYIQNLIDRINALNSDPQYVDRGAVRQLNAELDAILARLGQLNRQ
ncbi:MAG: hypothetical protein K2N31_02455 [Treponemataceae bacterium]|nr:hypothetical protein [Treponemataceae bacterium]